MAWPSLANLFRVVQLDVITRNGDQSGVMLSLEDCQAVQDTSGLWRCRLDREMVERIHKLIKEVQSSFGLVSGSQRVPTFVLGKPAHANGYQAVARLGVTKGDANVNFGSESCCLAVSLCLLFLLSSIIRIRAIRYGRTAKGSA